MKNLWKTLKKKKMQTRLKPFDVLIYPCKHDDLEHGDINGYDNVFHIFNIYTMKKKKKLHI